MKYIFLVILLLSLFSSNAQHQDKVDFINARILIIPNTERKNIEGNVTYEFDVLADIDSVFIDAKNMVFSSVLVDYNEVKYKANNNRIVLFENFKKGQERSITLRYTVKPKQTVYFLGWEDDIQGNEQIWTQGQGKYTSHWLPSFDDMEEKIAFDLSITFDERFKAVANGILEEKESQEPNSYMWSFDMQKPMSSYLLAFAIGNYNKQELISRSGIPIENYYYPQDSLKVEPTYRYTKRIFDFMEEEIGFPYPWQNYKQIPVRDFLYAGMENTSATIFSDEYVIDSTAFVDKNYVNVNAHELAHQWFGNLVTEKDGNHHWLHEGFATYYALLAEKEIFGDDHFYWKLYESLMELQSLVDRGEGQSLLNPKASSLVFYQKGAWALYMLKEEIGEKPFKRGIQSYLRKYQFKNVMVSNFLDEMETASNTDLSAFKKNWLENTEIPFQTTKKSLSKASASLNVLFSMEEKLKASQGDDFDFTSYWAKTNSVHLKKHIIKSYHQVLPQEILKQAILSDTIPIKQTMAIGTDSIPKFLKTEFESLLNDKSYITVENTLFKLWASFPQERGKYLDKTKDIIGLPNKNVRLLWLTLSLLTNGYDAPNTQKHFKELSNYTSNEYSWEVRMSAFQYLNQALGLTDESLENLINACVHHSWQFKKYARNLMVELLKDADYKIRIEKLAIELKGPELEYIKTKLDI